MGTLLTKNRKRVATLGVIAVLVELLFPPWRVYFQIDRDESYNVSTGHHFVFGELNRSWYVDISRLALELLTIIAVASLLVAYADRIPSKCALKEFFDKGLS